MTASPLFQYPAPLLQLTDGRAFSLGTIYCIGRNYAEHAREMQTDLPESPIVFLKPPSAYVPSGSTIVIPPGSTHAEHEVELVVVIGSHLHKASLDQAAEAAFGYAVGIDVTLRDLQRYAKINGLPWSLAKAFASSAPISPIVPANAIADITGVEFGIAVNSVVRQRATPNAMIWNIPALLSYLSQWFVLLPGDVVFTGTPEGVGPLHDGDHIHAWLGEYAQLNVQVSFRVA